MQDFASPRQPTGLAGSSAVLIGFALFVAFYSFIEIIRGYFSRPRGPSDFVLPLLSSHQGGSDDYGSISNGVLVDADPSYEQLLALGEVIGSVKTGLSDAEIEAVSTKFPYSSARASAAGSPRSCSICLENFSECESLLLLACNCQTFHAACVASWLHVKPSCPCCRFSFL